MVCFAFTCLATTRYHEFDRFGVQALTFCARKPDFPSRLHAQPQSVTARCEHSTLQSCGRVDAVAMPLVKVRYDQQDQSKGHQRNNPVDQLQEAEIIQDHLGHGQAEESDGRIAQRGLPADESRYDQRGGIQRPEKRHYQQGQVVVVFSVAGAPGQDRAVAVDVHADED